MESISNSSDAGVSQPPARRQIRALHIHLNASTSGGIARVAVLLQSLIHHSPEVQLAPNPVVQPAQNQQEQPAQNREGQPALNQGPVGQEYCSICRSYGADGELPCGHRFHNLCIRPWLLTHQKCADMYCARSAGVHDLRPL